MVRRESQNDVYLLLSLLDLELVTAELQSQVAQYEEERGNLQQTIRTLSRSSQRR